VIKALIITAPTFIFVGLCIYAACGGFKGLKKRGPVDMGVDHD
jgi:hypothetical protein